jgi:catechol 2,3-dioxygenase-like lactoylglutathione lyase family enzyme
MSWSISCIRLTLFILQPLSLTGWMLAHEWSLKNNPFNRPCSPRCRLSQFQMAESNNNEPRSLPSSLYIHHAALKTRNITTAIQFYTLLGFSVSCKFRAGPARAAWLEFPLQEPNYSNHHTCRLEIIEVPSYMLNEQEGTRKRAIDLMERQDFLGHNHLALDVTNQIENWNATRSLQVWMDDLNDKSMEVSGKKLRIALAPRQQLIGSAVYELAFLYDADGSLVELLYKQSALEQEIQSGWEPWDGKGFTGKQ